jgi:DNA mismatch repair ATPase MutS
VLDRAATVLRELEQEGAEVRDSLVEARDRRRPGMQQKSLFAPPPDPIVEELRGVDLDGLTPRAAHDLLRRWQERAAKK